MNGYLHFQAVSFARGMCGRDGILRGFLVVISGTSLLTGQLSDGTQPVSPFLQQQRNNTLVFTMLCRQKKKNIKKKKNKK
jgi:hypothetical protein